MEFKHYSIFLSIIHLSQLKCKLNGSRDSLFWKSSLVHCFIPRAWNTLTHSKCSTNIYWINTCLIVLRLLYQGLSSSVSIDACRELFCFFAGGMHSHGLVVYFHLASIWKFTIFPIVWLNVVDSHFLVSMCFQNYRITYAPAWIRKSFQ